MGKGFAVVITVVLSHRRAGSHVPHKSPDCVPAACMPDAARAVGRLPPGLLPGVGYSPGFDTIFLAYDTFSAVHLRSAPQPSPDGVLRPRLFPARSAPRLLNAAPVGGLKPLPARRLRGPSPISCAAWLHGSLSSSLRAFVAQYAQPVSLLHLFATSTNRLGRYQPERQPLRGIRTQ